LTPSSLRGTRSRHSPAKEFPEKAPQVIHDLTNNPAEQLNPRVARAIATTQPTSMREIANAYGRSSKEADTAGAI